MSKTPPEKQAEICGGQKPQWYCDYLLVQSILDGNTHIWDILYRKTYPIVYCYTRRIHAKWHISEDQVADVAMKPLPDVLQSSTHIWENANFQHGHAALQDTYCLSVIINIRCIISTHSVFTAHLIRFGVYQIPKTLLS